jgi:hypothetical protein
MGGLGRVRTENHGDPDPPGPGGIWQALRDLLGGL